MRRITSSTSITKQYKVEDQVNKPNFISSHTIYLCNLPQKNRSVHERNSIISTRKNIKLPHKCVMQEPKSFPTTELQADVMLI
ncbi:hypothetical protein K1719_045827 [Acacia pycnantha]|nr:hypothetical protein K1719_045827 [Acacia pycnantha]